LTGCVYLDAVDLADRSLPRHQKVRAPKVKQADSDNPKHMAKAMEDIAPYCPMLFDDPEATEQDHFNMALMARVFVERVSVPDADGSNIVRQMFLNCWALSVHYGLSDYRTFYEPLHALSPHTEVVDPAADRDAFMLFLGPGD